MCDAMIALPWVFSLIFLLSFNSQSHHCSVFEHSHSTGRAEPRGSIKRDGRKASCCVYFCYRPRYWHSLGCGQGARQPTTTAFVSRKWEFSVHLRKQGISRTTFYVNISYHHVARMHTRSSRESSTSSTRFSCICLFTLW